MTNGFEPPLAPSDAVGGQRRPLLVAGHGHGYDFSRAMPIEVIRGWLEAFNTADVDTLIAASDPEIRIRPLRVLPRAEYVGHDGIRALLSVLAAGPIADVVVTIDSVEVLDASRYVAQGCVNNESYTHEDQRRARLHERPGAARAIGELDESLTNGS